MELEGYVDWISLAGWREVSGGDGWSLTDGHRMMIGVRRVLSFYTAVRSWIDVRGTYVIDATKAIDDDHSRLNDFRSPSAT